MTAMNYQGIEMNDNAKAASILRQYAGELYQGHTIGGQWDEGCRIKAEHDELLALADRLAIAQGEAVPVAWLRKNGFRFNGEIEPQDDSELPLYTHPAPSADRVAELEAQLAESREREAKLIADLDANLDAHSDERKRALSAESLARELHEMLADYVSQDGIAQGYGAGIGGTTYEKAEALLAALAADKEKNDEH